MMNDTQKLEYLKLLEKKVEINDGLPHLHGFPFYKWSREFFETTNKNAFLCAGNQLSKSSSQIRKIIHWATEESLWPSLWRQPPKMFWYLYPTKETATIEWRTKWLPEFMPRGHFAEHGKYAWQPEYRHKYIWAIHFAKVSIYFRTYMQDEEALQAGSCDFLGADEELPSHLWPELNMRRSARDGYFSMVWTPTLGEMLWKDTMEGQGEKEKFPDAWKKQVSLLDCMTYEDGTPSPWTPERVNQIINSCPTPQEVQRRVYGKYIIAQGLKYPSFSRDANVKKPSGPIEKDWLIFSGVDIGSGGEGGHPGAIAFVAVNQTFTKGRVFRGWRGDKNQNTSAGDILNIYREMRGFMSLTGEFYDHQARDFLTISARAGENFQSANKKQDEGQDILNTLFKNKMLEIDDTQELVPLMEEFETLLESTSKQKAKDDFIDALRFAVSRISWDWASITKEYVLETTKINPTELDYRRGEIQAMNEQFSTMFDPEIEEWNEYFEE